MSGEYPDDWQEIADRIKGRFHGCCERCGHPHDPANGYTLTVHHLVPEKSLCEDWNLAALCQRCHLSIQARVHMFQELLPGAEISAWFIPHLQGFRSWHVARLAAGITATSWASAGASHQAVAVDALAELRAAVNRWAAGA